MLHSCDVTRCIEPNHLFLGTKADNTADMRRKGRGFDIPPRRGSSNERAVLTEEQIPAIRADNRLLREIAEDYGVHLSLISLVKRRKVWKHVQ